MLSEPEIWEYIKAGRLEIEPLLADQIGSASVDLRIGTSLVRGRPRSSVMQLRIGDTVRAEPGEWLQFVTLESVSIPDDLSGIVMPKSRLARAGLIVPASRIDPDWRGKLLLVAFNLSGEPLELRVGGRIVSVIFFKVASSLAPRHFDSDVSSHSLDMAVERGSVFPTFDKERIDDRSSQVYRVGEFSDLVDAARLLTERVTGSERGTAEALASLLKSTLTERDAQKKGRLLEDLVEELISQVRGFRVIKRNARLRAEEIDLVVMNAVDSAFARSLSNPLVVECKNWSTKVGVAEIDQLAAKMTSLSPEVRTGILVAVNGITGDSYRDAELRRRECRQRGLYILVIERADLEAMAEGKLFWSVLEQKHSELYLI